MPRWHGAERQAVNDMMRAGRFAIVRRPIVRVGLMTVIAAIAAMAIAFGSHRARRRSRFAQPATSEAMRRRDARRVADRAAAREGERREAVRAFAGRALRGAVRERVAAAPADAEVGVLRALRPRHDDPPRAGRSRAGQRAGGRAWLPPSQSLRPAARGVYDLRRIVAQPRVDCGSTVAAARGSQRADVRRFLCEAHGIARRRFLRARAGFDASRIASATTFIRPRRAA